VYSQTLLNAVPMIDAGRRSRYVATSGEPPSPTRIPAGCPFHPRCPKATDECLASQPFHRVDDEHEAACRLADPQVLASGKLSGGTT
jgi:dipeptide transport system ATP-binding protein